MLVEEDGGKGQAGKEGGDLATQLPGLEHLKSILE